MTLNIVDLSNNNGVSTVDRFPADGYMFKSTEGTNFIDKYCDKLVNDAKKKGKLWGFYHFINSADWKAQADFFVNQTLGYWGHGVPALDYEMYGRIGTDKLLKMLRYIEGKTGVKCLVYTSASVLFEEDFSQIAKENYGLWVAAYQSNVPKIKSFESIAMWQYTSTPYDKNYFYGDKVAWGKYAGVKKDDLKPTPTPEKPKPTFTKIAEDGYFGPATVKRLQEYFGTTQDGVLSHQYKQECNKHLVAVQWDKSLIGSNVVKKMQQKLGVPTDGLLGRATIVAMQKRFGTTKDGVISAPSNMVKAMQKKLNNNQF